MAAAKGWHREDIKAALRKRFGGINALSRAWGYNPKAISNALGHKRSTIVERRIADALDVTPHTLWPDRWTPEGTPVTGRAQTAPAAAPRHRQNQRAA